MNASAWLLHPVIISEDYWIIPFWSWEKARQGKEYAIYQKEKKQI